MYVLWMSSGSIRELRVGVFSLSVEKKTFEVFKYFFRPVDV